MVTLSTRRIALVTTEIQNSINRQTIHLSLTRLNIPSSNTAVAVSCHYNNIVCHNTPISHGHGRTSTHNGTRYTTKLHRVNVRSNIYHQHIIVQHATPTPHRAAKQKCWWSGQQMYSMLKSFASAQTINVWDSQQDN